MLSISRFVVVVVKVKMCSGTRLNYFVVVVAFAVVVVVVMVVVGELFVVEM